MTRAPREKGKRLAARGEAKDGETRNRTGDTTIFSRVLYQLSYLAERVDASGWWVLQVGAP